jgi:hypothetical protein
VLAAGAVRAAGRGANRGNGDFSSAVLSPAISSFSRESVLSAPAKCTPIPVEYGSPAGGSRACVARGRNS